MPLKRRVREGILSNSDGNQRVLDGPDPVMMRSQIYEAPTRSSAPSSQLGPEVDAPDEVAGQGAVFEDLPDVGRVEDDLVEVCGVGPVGLGSPLA
jgi:hypothetical protein